MISESYNKWSQIYDTNLNKTRDMDRIATMQMLDNYPFERVIELGCGTGKNTLWLMEKASQIVGIDFSEGMLAKAKAKIQSEQVEFHQADISQAWPVADNWADLITCSLTLEHIEDLNPIFQQAAQKLQQGGHFFVCELHPFKQYIGSKARFEDDKGLEVLEVYVHHLGDYWQAAKRAGFELVQLKEWFDPEEGKPPRLISLLFRLVY